MEFVKQHRTEFEVDELCEALGVSRSGYYRWEQDRWSIRRQQDEQIKTQIESICRQARGRYGYRPVHGHLVEAGIDCGRDRTLRLMRELKLSGPQAKRFKPFGTDSNHLFGYHPNLLRQLGKPEHRDQVWVADTTYLLSDDGWCYLATVMDLCTRRIVGWSVSDRNDAELVCTALENAALSRGEVRAGIVHHSDRGSTYASDRYQRLLARLKMHPSMSGKGHCYDNAAMESFFGRYKTSSVRAHVFADEAQIRANVFEYIEVFYNRFRKHASLGYLSPMQAEEKSCPPWGARKMPLAHPATEPITPKIRDGRVLQNQATSSCPKHKTRKSRPGKLRSRLLRRNGRRNAKRRCVGRAEPSSRRATHRSFSERGKMMPCSGSIPFPPEPDGRRAT
jgi:putative transposase